MSTNIRLWVILILLVAIFVKLQTMDAKLKNIDWDGRQILAKVANKS